MARTKTVARMGCGGGYQQRRKTNSVNKPIAVSKSVAQTSTQSLPQEPNNISLPSQNSNMEIAIIQEGTNTQTLTNISNENSTTRFAGTSNNLVHASQPIVLHLRDVLSFQVLQIQLQKYHFNYLHLLRVDLKFSVNVDQLFKQLQPLTNLKLLGILLNSDSCVKKCNECDICKKSFENEPLTLFQRKRRNSLILPMVLPSVESLEFSCASPFLSFYFLSSLPKLSCFRLDCENLLGKRKEEDEIGIELRKMVYQKQEENTKLWDLLPSLTRLIIGEGGRLYERPLMIESHNVCVSKFEKILPQIFCDLERKDWLKLRFVCKTWKHATEKFILSHPICRPYNFNTYKQTTLARKSEQHLDKSVFPMIFTTANSFEEYLQNCQQTGHPFFERCVMLAPIVNGIDCKNTSQKYWDSAIIFVGCVGHNIHSLKLSYKYSDLTDSESSFFSCIALCLQQVPNLKLLQICGEELHISAASAEDEKEYMSMIKLPELEHLETLQLVGDMSIIPTITNCLFSKYAKQIQRLDLSMIEKWWSPAYGDLPNLVQLNVKNITNNKMLSTLLCSLSKPNALKKLELSEMTSIEDCYLFKLLLSFNNIRVFTLSMKLHTSLLKEQNIPKDLKDVGVVWGAAKPQLINPLLHSRLVSDANKNRRIIQILSRFPSIEYVSISACHPKQTFDFLVLFPCMKYLKIQICKDLVPSDYLSNELFKFVKGGQMAQESVIWEKFPRLKEISILPGINLSRVNFKPKITLVE